MTSLYHLGDRNTIGSYIVARYELVSCSKWTNTCPQPWLSLINDLVDDSLLELSPCRQKLTAASDRRRSSTSRQFLFQHFCGNSCRNRRLLKTFKSTRFQGHVYPPKTLEQDPPTTGPSTLPFPSYSLPSLLPSYVLSLPPLPLAVGTL